MLQALRDKTSGLIAKIVLGTLVFVFSFFGIESYFIARTDQWVAKVGDREINPDQFSEKFNNYRQYMMNMSRGQLDGAYFERKEIKRQVLDSMIDQQLLLAANEKLGIVVTDQQVQQDIRSTAAFQTEGKFDANIYKAMLSNSRRTPLTYQEEVRNDLAVKALPEQIAATAVVTATDIDAYIKLRDETRDIDYVLLDKPATAPAAVADADIDAYFNAHGNEFMTPEQVALEYIELDGAKLKSEVVIDDAEVKKQYDKDKARYVSAEQRMASHILVKVAKNADADAQKAALAKAQELAKQAKSAKDFGALAKQSSDDLGSKAQGGDLGWIEKGVTDPAFEAALFGMNKGDISEPVLSAEGYHVIQLRDVRAERTRPLEEVKAEITKQLQDSERERAFNEVAGKFIDSLQQNPASLEPTAQALGLTVQKTALITRQGGAGIAANPAVLKAAFSDQVLVEGRVSDAIDEGADKKVAVRVAEHKAAVPKALADVRDEIRGKLAAQQAAKAARERADALLKRLQAGEALDKLASEAKLKLETQAGLGRNAANVDGKLVEAAFKQVRPNGDKPTSALATLLNDSYALVQLKAVREGDVAKVDQAGRDQVRQQLQQEFSGAAARAFVASLRKSTKVQIAEDRIP